MFLNRRGDVVANDFACYQRKKPMQHIIQLGQPLTVLFVIILSGIRCCCGCCWIDSLFCLQNAIINVERQSQVTTAQCFVLNALALSSQGRKVFSLIGYEIDYQNYDRCFIFCWTIIHKNIAMFSVFIPRSRTMILLLYLNVYLTTILQYTFQ